MPLHITSRFLARLQNSTRVPLPILKLSIVSFILLTQFCRGQDVIEVVDVTSTLDNISLEVDRFKSPKEVDGSKSSQTPVPDIIYPNFVAPKYDTRITGYSVGTAPSPRGKGVIGYVSDPNNYIPFDDELRINKLLYSLEKQSTAEVAIVMLPSIGAEVPKDFAVRLFENWSIGKEDTDNGLLIVTVMDQRRTEFETGYGLESILTDVICFRIGTQ